MATPYEFDTLRFLTLSGVIPITPDSCDVIVILRLIYILDSISIVTHQR